MAKQKESKTTEKYSGQYWNYEILDAKHRHEQFFWKEADESIKVYNTKHAIGSVERRINVWWYIVNTLLPAYFSSTPKANVSLRKYAGKQVYDLSAVLLERTIQSSMDIDFDFDFVGLNSAIQFLLTGRGVLWAKYEGEFGEPEEFEVFDRDGQLFDAYGNPIGDDAGELQETEYGLILQVPKLKGEKAILESIQYNDYINSDARNEEEIVWRSKRAFLTEEQVEDLFGPDMVKSLSFDAQPETSKADWRRNIDQTIRRGRAELWEVWCEESEKVYWIQPRGNKTIIESSDVPIRYRGFYPCSVINASLDPNSTIPVSDYTHAKDQILEVERISSRIHATTQAIRTNGLYDQTVEGFPTLFKGDLQLTPTKNWPSYKSKGGLAQSFEMFPIEPYVKALETLLNARQEAVNRLFEMLKVSDLLRGASEPTKTATANRLENSWSSLGLIVRQNQFAKFVGDGVDKLGTIIAEKFEPETILDRGDAETLLQPLCDSPETYQMMCQEVIKPLKDQSELFKLEIATDSMVALDQKQERDDGVALLQSAGSFFDQMKGTIEQYPPLASFAISLFENVIRRYRGGKELEALFTKTLSDIQGMVLQKQEQAAQQPPDPKVIESQTKMQIAQMEAEGRMQIAQLEAQATLEKNALDSQDKHQANLLEMQRLSTDSQLQMWKAQEEIKFKQQELDMKGRELEIQIIKLQMEGASQAAQLALQEKIAALDGIIAQQKVEIEHSGKKIDQYERLIEEKRLAQEDELRREELSIKKEEVAVKKQALNQKPKKKKITLSDGTSGEVTTED